MWRQGEEMKRLVTTVIRLESNVTWAGEEMALNAFFHLEGPKAEVQVYGVWWDDIKRPQVVLDRLIQIMGEDMVRKGWHELTKFVCLEFESITHEHPDRNYTHYQYRYLLEGQVARNTRKTDFYLTYFQTLLDRFGGHDYVAVKHFAEEHHLSYQGCWCSPQAVAVRLVDQHLNNRNPQERKIEMGGGFYLK